jgi:hypothetical protein
MTNFSTLQSNLSEIHSAVYAEEPILPLFPTSSTTVQCTCSAWGKGIWLYHNAWKMLPFKTPALSLSTTIQSIMQCFDNAVNQVLKSRKNKMLYYASNLDTLPIRTKKSEEFDLVAHRQTVVNFQYAAEQFWKIFSSASNSDSALKKQFLAYVNNKSRLFDKEAQKEVTKEFAWLFCEGLMQMEIPVSLLFKVHQFSEFSTTENGKFTSWIKAINELERFPAASFFSILCDVIQIIGIKNPSFTMQHLVKGLETNGCSILQKVDDEQLNWRDRHSSGDIVECNRISLTLSEELGVKKKTNNHFRVFELMDFPEFVIKIPDNRFRLCLQNRDPVFRMAQIIHEFNIKKHGVVSAIDAKARFSITEKLIPLFEKSPWTSTEYILCKNDIRLALIFANHLLYFQFAQISPGDLSVNHLCLSQDGMLKSIRFIPVGAKNYNRLEQFCVNIARDNLYVLSFLINVSRLSENSIAHFYRKVVSKAFEFDAMSLLGEPLPNGHDREADVYNEHAKNLCEIANKMKADCIIRVKYELRRQKKEFVEDTLEEEIGKKLAIAYCNSLTPGILNESIVDKVENSYKNELSEVLKKESHVHFGEYDQYYKKKFVLLSEYEGRSKRLFVEEIEKILGFDDEKEHKLREKVREKN